MSDPVESRTRGFLFADLRGYTQFAESHGDQAAALLLTRYRVLVRDVIARFNGAEIKTEGDNFYVVFSSASSAVQGGRAIIDAAAAAGSEPGAAEIRVGVGVHAGETAETPEGLVGSAINLAARICALAGPGELLVSDTVRGLTRTFLGLQFVPRGRQRLKGIEEPVRVYQVLPSTAATDAAARSGRWEPRRSRALTATAIGLLIALLAGVLLLGALPGNGPFGPRSRPSAASALASGAAGTGATSTPRLTAAEQTLFEKLPRAMRGDCSAASTADGSAGGSASLHCRLPLGEGADEFWVDEFLSSDALIAAFTAAVGRAGQPPRADCKSTPTARGRWAVPTVHAGDLLCYQEGGAAWIVWTYDLDRILVKARRADVGSRSLYDWWRETAIFLR
jgi:class 3 adenylate cyclase